MFLVFTMSASVEIFVCYFLIFFQKAGPGFVPYWFRFEFLLKTVAHSEKDIRCCLRRIPWASMADLINYTMFFVRNCRMISSKIHHKYWKITQEGFSSSHHRNFLLNIFMYLQRKSKTWRKPSSQFRQGDVELALGWNPIPLFNRANFPELASMQVKNALLLCPSSAYGTVSRALVYVVHLHFWSPHPDL